MRWPNDIRLAENVPDIDLILGGHDHDYTVRQVSDNLENCTYQQFDCLNSQTLYILKMCSNLFQCHFSCLQVDGRFIIKSGTDFRNFSHLTLTFDPEGKVDIKVDEVTVDSSLKEDEEIKKW